MTNNHGRGSILGAVEQAPDAAHGQTVTLSPGSPGFRLLHVLLHWLVAAISVLVAAAIVPHVSVGNFGQALVAAALIAILNAVLPPLVAAVRLPFTLSVGFVAVLLLDALILMLASQIDPNAIKVDSLGWALLAALVMAAASVVLEAILGVDDDDGYMLRVIRRVARRQGSEGQTDVPGIIFLEIDGLALPATASDAGRKRARDGPLAQQRLTPTGGVGDRSELADRGQPGRDPARVK